LEKDKEIAAMKAKYEEEIKVLNLAVERQGGGTAQALMTLNREMREKVNHLQSELDKTSQVRYHDEL
jgi:hypothetical protein